MSGGGKKKVGVNKKVRKQGLFARINSLFTEYDKMLIVGADNVGSNHMQKIRIALRGAQATLFVGKNTMIRKALKGLITTRPALENLLPAVKGNVGFVFTKGDIGLVRKLINENKVEAPARAGAIAPSDVIVPAGSTGLEPTKTSFFQALQIATRITKGTIEIINDVKIISAGSKVGPSEAALLQMLNIRPFQYGLAAQSVYDSGALFDISVLDISNEDILKKFQEGVRNIATVSLAINHPTMASVPHSLLNGYKNIVSVALATEITFKQVDQLKADMAYVSVMNALTSGYKNVLSVALATNVTFKQADEVKAYLANPTAFAAKGGDKGGDKGAKKDEGKKDEGKKDDKGAKGGKKEEPKKEEKKEEPAEEEDMGLGLFD